MTADATASATPSNVCRVLVSFLEKDLRRLISKRTGTFEIYLQYDFRNFSDFKYFLLFFLRVHREGIHIPVYFVLRQIAVGWATTLKDSPEVKNWMSEKIFKKETDHPEL
jgi:hypothetical protein